MPKGYWIAHVDVQNPDAYKNYVSANGVAFAKFGGRFLVRGGQHETVEGKTRSRNVVIEFPSYEAALACVQIRQGEAPGRSGRRHHRDRGLRRGAAGISEWRMASSE
jgi:uncharacterized protein (DUF1330 family)